MDEQEIQKAIDRLSDLIPNGHLLATTGCINFLESVADYIKALQGDKNG